VHSFEDSWSPSHLCIWHAGTFWRVHPATLTALRKRKLVKRTVDHVDLHEYEITALGRRLARASRRVVALGGAT
jgi:hypothetical protein